MNFVNPISRDWTARLIILLAVAAVGAAVGLGLGVSTRPEPSQQNLDKLQVAKILIQNRDEMKSIGFLIAGCMTKVMSSPELVAKLLEYPPLCAETVQPIGLRIVAGNDSVCKLGDSRCAFAAGYIRVVAATRTEPKTAEEVDQLSKTITAEFEKLQQKAQEQ
jgi:hypothetical protein